MKAGESAKSVSERGTVPKPCAAVEREDLNYVQPGFLIPFWK